MVTLTTEKMPESSMNTFRKKIHQKLIFVSPFKFLVIEKLCCNFFNLLDNQRALLANHADPKIL